MARKDVGLKVDRRKFLTGVAVAGAASAVTPQAGNATTAVGTAAARLPSALPPTAHTIAAETGTPRALAQTNRPDGSDFMVDVIKSLDIDYLPSNPASSFRGLHESLINYGKNKKPEFLTVNHEEIGVAMAHGYFKVAGKPMLTLCHGTVGLQHASMAIYNAWCDRVPVIVVGGNKIDASKPTAIAARLRSRASALALREASPRFSIAALRLAGIAAFTASISAGSVDSASAAICTSTTWKRWKSW